MSSITRKITESGQSLWLDNIQRSALDSGELKRLIEENNIRGITSNPTIFNHAIAKSKDYDTALTSLAWAGWDAEKIFWELAVEDIRDACDAFMPVYEQSNGEDGYVSLEESPSIARDTQASIIQAQQLWARVARPNLFIKIPATAEAIPAIRRSLASGVNVNITLIFSLERYEEVMEAYLSALEDRLAAGQSIDHIASVASFFVSRVDTKIDGWLDGSSPLRGKAAIANAKLAYEAFLRTFTGERWEKLKANGARLQRPLWASTSTKNPAYLDTMYVDELIGKHTVNTLPPQTLKAVSDHGKSTIAITQAVDQARLILDNLAAQGISIDKATHELEEEGVQSFLESFNTLIETIEQRRSEAIKSLGPLTSKVVDEITRLESNKVPKRIWEHDPSLWSKDDTAAREIRNRLGWLELPTKSRDMIHEITKFAREMHEAEFRKFLLLGMGGSSLAPEVFSELFKPTDYELAILDSTDPVQILQAEKRFPPDQTLFILSSKSGNTLEVNALYDHFWELSHADGSRFIAITDPGTPLDSLAKARKFRKIFHADQTVGGRYSALSTFGLVPAGLMGLDLEEILNQAVIMQNQCSPIKPAGRNPGAALGAVLGVAAREGRDKLTILSDESIKCIGSWLEQLIAESSGKDGKGILPVDLEPLGDRTDYDEDRLFVYLKHLNQLPPEVIKLQEAGFPCLVFPVGVPASIAAEMYRWEYAIATACHILKVNAFDQPNVEDHKSRTKVILENYLKTGHLDLPTPNSEIDGVKIYSSVETTGMNLKECIKGFLEATKPHDFIAINAFVPRDGANLEVLTRLRLNIRTGTKCATTLGFGPRYLHSTGQLHKGGANNGNFLMITVDPDKDIQIPTQELTFGELELAQALGDYQALTARQRRVMWINLATMKDLRLLSEALR